MNKKTTAKKCLTGLRFRFSSSLKKYELEKLKATITRNGGLIDGSSYTEAVIEVRFDYYVVVDDSDDTPKFLDIGGVKYPMLPKNQLADLIKKRKKLLFLENL